MHHCYILFSASRDKFYIGETGDLEARLAQHNLHFFKGAATTIASDWIIYLTFPFENRAKAKAFEKFPKSMKSRKIFKDLR